MRTAQHRPAAARASSVEVTGMPAGIAAGAAAGRAMVCRAPARARKSSVAQASIVAVCFYAGSEPWLRALRSDRDARHVLARGWQAHASGDRMHRTACSEHSMSQTHEIRKILIANRGEIAVRILRTCRTMGIDTVAVFSDADERAPHVRLADEAVRIGPPPAAQSYLDIARILDAAARTGADAVHPGYGFLSENADFCAACRDRGLVFIGPGPDVIRLLGKKREAKRVAAAAGVPVVPGYDGDEQDTAALAARARELGFPVLIKASAGGGGKGMRVVRAGDDLGAAIDSARREAGSAFGDDTLLIERYVERPRHIEMQILGDSHGNVVHLFERECSIQRRHQKIIEESPALDEALRDRMGAAAVAVGKAVRYENAGTVEFILAPDGQFHFLEVNTRLQVEHPVTEAVTGLDLVREQIRIARGEPLDPAVLRASAAPASSAFSMRGAAMECRLYAEDPGSQFLPAAGHLSDWYLPALDGVRVDAGVEAGQAVSVHYDPMLAKIICHAPTRGEVIARLTRFLREMSVQGVVTNRALLIRVLSHPAFRAGEIDTHFLERHADELLEARRAPGQAPDAETTARWRHAAVAATLWAHEARRGQRAILPALEPGFRNSRFRDEQVEYEIGAARVCVQYRNLGGGRLRVEVMAGGEAPVADIVRVAHIDGPWLHVEDGRSLRRFRVVVDSAASPLWEAASSPRWFVHTLDGDVALTEVPRFADARKDAVAGGLSAPMPGKVVKVLVTAGQAVTAGDTLLVLEAMKMEHPVRAPIDGVVAELPASEGEQVDAGQLLAVVEPAAST
jgi:propionyl-CoA carboxylase alpha chain